VGALLAISLILATLAGCSSLRMPDVNMPKLRWPFSAKPVPAPEPVDEVIFEAPAAQSPATVVAFPQYFKRNTLIIDLTSASGSGSVLLRPKTPAGWPMRVAFRVKPGSFEALEINAGQRVLLPVVAKAKRPTLDLELPPALVRARSDDALQLRWGAVVPPPVAPPAVSSPDAPPASDQSPPTS
jgi:hypothetical protein